MGGSFLITKLYHLTQISSFPSCHFKDEDLREVSLHSLFEDMVCCRLYCRTLLVLGLEIVHDGVAEGPHAAHRPRKPSLMAAFPCIRSVGKWGSMTTASPAKTRIIASCKSAISAN